MMSGAIGLTAALLAGLAATGCGGGASDLRGGPGEEPTPIDTGAAASGPASASAGPPAEGPRASATEADLERIRDAPAPTRDSVTGVVVLSVPRSGLVLARRALASGDMEGCAAIGERVVCGRPLLEAAVRAHALGREPARIDSEGWRVLVSLALGLDLDVTSVHVTARAGGGADLAVSTHVAGAPSELRVAIDASGAVTVP